jgi:hypothetical protein
VIPERVTPTGLGGYVGHNPDPVGDVVGRRVQGRLIVTVRAANLAGIAPAAQAASTALLGSSAAELRGQGILRLAIDDLGDTSISGEGQNQIASRDLGFSVLFEHLNLPVASEGVIETVPQLIETGSTERGGTVLLSEEFMAASLNRFEIFDDPLATQGQPSEWVYNPTEHRIEQLRNIRGGTNTPTPSKPGTYLVLRTTPTLPAVRDFVMSTELSSDDVDTIGLVFRFQDVENFMFLVLDARTGFRMLARKLAGTFEALDPPAVVNVEGFTVGQIHSVRIVAQGEAFRVHVDGELTLEASDDSLPLAGRVGFLARANTAAHFYRLDLTEL